MRRDLKFAELDFYTGKEKGEHMKNINNENYYAYDEKNIAKNLQKAMSDNADPTVVRYLNEARKKKIASGGEGMQMYKNDNLTQAADEYVQSFKKPDIEKLNEARINLQKNRLKQAYAKIQNMYDSGLDAVSEAGAEARRLAAAEEMKIRFDTEDMLAKAGLGRGAYSKASSGFSESARAKLVSDAAEKIIDTYKDEQAKKMALASEAVKAISEAEQNYTQNADKAYSQLESDSIELDNNDKNMRAKLMDMASQNRHNERDFDYTKQSDMYEREYQKERDEKEFARKQSQQEYDNAMSAFEMTGVINTQRQAEILGLPIGTRSEYMEDLAYRKAKDEADAKDAKDQAEFDRAYSMFTSTGVVQSSKQANVLGVPVGTTYWEYVLEKSRAETAKISANASQTSANASVMSARASQTNAAANYKNAQTNEKNAQTKAAESSANQRKIDEQIETTKAKRERQNRIDNY